MTLAKGIESFLLYDGLSKENYQIIKNDLHEQNRRNLVSYTLLMGIIFAILTLATFFVDSIAVNRLSYALAFAATTILCVILTTIAKKSWVVVCVINYIFCSIILGFCTYIGTYTAVDQLATSYCVSLAILPFVTYDATWRSIIYRIIMCAIFVVVDINVKEYTYVSRDIVNISCYWALGTFAGAIAQRIKAQASFLKNNMDGAIRQQSAKIENLSIQSITAMAAAVDAKDKYTNGHSQRVAKYSKMIAKAMGKTMEEQERIYSTALLHDIGKIGIPDAIIQKPERLTEEEYNIIKTHTVQGYEILKKINEIPDIAVGAKYHHERYDGKGYPEHLSGEKIPEIARIIAVADAYDAMTSDRSYRKTMKQSQAYEEIQKGIGTQFDPKIAGYMLDIIIHDAEYTLRG